jgi:hypothetical protein
MTNTFTHHELTAKWIDDNQGKAIMLTQPNGNFDEPGTVTVHPSQLRAVCEQFGIITSDPHTAKTVATLTRRLHLLRDRIERLHHYLVNHSDHKHADLSYEVIYATATIDIADEFCDDLMDEPCNDRAETVQQPARAEPTQSSLI